MSPVRRRSPRKPARWLIPALLAALAVILGAVWLLLRKAPVSLPDPVTAQPVTLSDRAEAEITRIAIENRYDAPYALIRQDGQWRMAGEEDFTFRASTLEEIVKNAALIVTEDTVGDLAAHAEWQLMHFRLEEPAARSAVDFADGSSLAFRIGDSVPQETPAYYFLLEGDSHIYTISADVYEAYTYTRAGLHDVADPAVNGALIDRISFAGDHAFTAERRADGWYLTEPLCYPLADAAMDSLLQKLEGLRFAQYVGQAEQVDLSALGLAPAARTVTLDIAESIVTGYDENGQAYADARLPAYQLRFDLGDQESDIVFYCLYRGQVMKATVFSDGFLLTQDYAPLLLTAPFNAPTNDLTGLVIQRGDQRLEYALSLRERVLPNNRFETDENGNIIYDLYAERGGQAVESDAFLAAYRQLLELRTTDRLPADYQLPGGAPALAVSFTRAASARQVALYPLDALHYAVAVDGVALFQVEKGWAEGIDWP